MRTLAHRTREKKLAAKAAQKASAATSAKVPVDASAQPRKTAEQAQYDALLVVLHNDLREIGEIQSISARNPVKQAKAAQYTSWVDGILEAGKAGHSPEKDEIVGTMLVWALDIGDYARAQDIAQHMVTYNMPLPDRFDRSTACYFVETLAELSLKSSDDAPAISHDILVAAHLLTEKADMPDEAKAKVQKALGRSYQAAADAHDPKADNAVAGGKQALLTAAKDHYQSALSLNSKAGVKRNITEVTKQLEEMTQEQN